MSIQLTVWKSLKEDVNKNFVRIPQKVRDILNLNQRHEVTLVFKNKKVTIPFVRGDRKLIGQMACRLNARIRSKLNVSPGDSIDIYINDAQQIGVPEIDSRYYDIVIVERDTDNPFQISSKMLDISKKEVSKERTRKGKAKKLFDWMQKNIQYGSGRRPNVGYRDSIEVKISKEGVCGEQAILYIAMARCVGLVANYVSVSVDFQGKRVNHACAAVKLRNATVLVDPAYHSFDIKHKQYRIESDEMAHRLFKAFRG